eukprot:s49_g14.t1
MEECKTALSRKGFKDDPFGPELWVRVLKEHHRHLTRPGVYVDLAAHDFRYISNTYFADHCLKFDGVCIEPNSDYHSELITNLQDHFFPTGVLA